MNGTLAECVGCRAPAAACAQCPYTQGERAPVVREELPPDAAESLFQERVIKIAEGYGYRHWHNTNPRRSAKGWFDLVLWRGPKVGYPPRVIYAELKKVTGRQSEAQKMMAAGFIDAGQEVYCWWPKQLSEIEEVLK